MLEFMRYVPLFKRVLFFDVLFALIYFLISIYGIIPLVFLNNVFMEFVSQCSGIQDWRGQSLREPWQYLEDHGQV